MSNVECGMSNGRRLSLDIPHWTFNMGHSEAGWIYRGSIEAG